MRHPPRLGLLVNGLGASVNTNGRTGGVGEKIDTVRFGKVESEIIKAVKRRLCKVLNWSMTTIQGAKPGLPSSFRIRHAFAGEQVETIPFNNLPKS